MTIECTLIQIWHRNAAYYIFVRMSPILKMM